MGIPCSRIATMVSKLMALSPSRFSCRISTLSFDGSFTTRANPVTASTKDTVRFMWRFYSLKQKEGSAYPSTANTGSGMAVNLTMTSPRRLLNCSCPYSINHLCREQPLHEREENARSECLPSHSPPRRRRTGRFPFRDTWSKNARGPQQIHFLHTRGKEW